MVYAGVPAGVEAFRLARAGARRRGHHAGAGAVTPRDGPRLRRAGQHGRADGRQLAAGRLRAWCASTLPAPTSACRRARPRRGRSPTSPALPTRCCSACPTVRRRSQSSDAIIASRSGAGVDDASIDLSTVGPRPPAQAAAAARLALGITYCRRAGLGRRRRAPGRRRSR